MPRAVRDFTGAVFGRLTVKSQAKDTVLSSGRRLIAWNCECTCGKSIIVPANNLRNGNTKSCGCMSEIREYRVHDLTGKRFGRLHVVGVHSKRVGKRKLVAWDCLCLCSEFKIVVVIGDRLVQGSKKSCGCLTAKGNGFSDECREKAAEVATKHGMYGTRLYSVWCSMKQRCSNPNAFGYKRYGGRGIRVCDEWVESFVAFFEDMSEGYEIGLHLDRRDNDGNYCKDNCRWVTPKKNANNKSDTIIIEYEGVTKSLMEWCEDIGGNYSTMYMRHARGKSPREILYGK